MKTKNVCKILSDNIKYYICLQAYSGLVMSIVVILRNVLFQKNITTRKIIFIIFLMALSSIFTYSSITSILPIIACIEYSIVLGKEKLKFLRISEIISCILYLIYDINVLAYIGVASTILELVFAIISIWRFDLRKEKKRK